MESFNAVATYAAAPQFRPQVWYPLAGFAMLAVFCFTIFGFTVWARINGWIAFIVALIGGGLALTAGMYATRDTFIEALLSWAAGWHPVVAFALAFIVLGGICYLAVAAVPDTFAPAVSLSLGLAVLAFFLPVLTVTSLPDQGSIWTGARRQVNGLGDQLVEATDGWFWAPSAKNTARAAGGTR